MTKATSAQVAPTTEQIKAAREAAGLSQTAAAALVYAGMRGWQEWEAGNRTMHPGLWEMCKHKARRASQGCPSDHPVPS